MKKVMRHIISLVLLLSLSLNQTIAQCAMCKASAETSVEAGASEAAGINNGVLYVLVILFFMLLGFVFLFKNAKQLLNR